MILSDVLWNFSRVETNFFIQSNTHRHCLYVCVLTHSWHNRQLWLLAQTFFRPTTSVKPRRIINPLISYTLKLDDDVFVLYGVKTGAVYVWVQKHAFLYTNTKPDIFFAYPFIILLGKDSSTVNVENEIKPLKKSREMDTHTNYLSYLYFPFPLAGFICQRVVVVYSEVLRTGKKVSKTLEAKTTINSN